MVHPPFGFAEAFSLMHLYLVVAENKVGDGTTTGAYGIVIMLFEKFNHVSWLILLMM